MTVALDATALLARQLDHPTRAVVTAALDADPEWCASALALGEAIVLARRLADDPVLADPLADAVIADWRRFVVVPVDERCLARAAELASDHPLRMVDAIHLAAADRLPRPVTFVTFDAAQIPVALALGFAVASS